MEYRKRSILIRHLMFSCCLFVLSCSSQPDVILITLDTLRVDHVSSFYPNSTSKTPHIDALSADGVKYTQAYSPISVTGPAFVTLHTGQDPGTHRVFMNVFRGGAYLEDDKTTLAERFQSHRYETGAFVSGFTLRKSLGLSQGFDRYDQPASNQNRRWGNITAKKATRWLKNQEGPVFLWYHSYDAHGPWNRWSSRPRTMPELSEEGQVEYDEIQSSTPSYQLIRNVTTISDYKLRYAKAVEFADVQVGKIIKALKETGRYEKSTIILTADHGESFDERELWFDHGTTAHEEQLHVPLIIKYPKNARAGESDQRLIGLKDIAPTLTELTNMPSLPQVDGVSLLPSNDSWQGWESLSGESSHCKKEESLNCVPIGPKGKSFALRTKEYSATLSPSENGDQAFGYSRESDLQERLPISIPEEMSIQLREFAAQRRVDVESIIWPPAPLKNQTKDESSEAEMLKSLGYIDD